MSKHRIQKLQEMMRADNISAAIIIQPRDLYYYTGTSQPCNLVVPHTGDPVLFVRRAEDFVRTETWIEDVQTGGSPKQLLKSLHEMGISSGVLGIEGDIVVANLYLKLRDAFSDYSLKDISPLVLTQRMIKEPGEIELVKGASHRFDLAHETILRTLRPGMSEVELGGRLAEVLFAHETEQVLFIRRWDDWLQPAGTIVSGENLYQISGHAMTVTGVGLSPAMPWGPSSRRFKKGDLVVVDNPLNYRGYHSDNTRTYVVGKASNRQKEVYGAVRELQDYALAQIRPGIWIDEVYRLVIRKVTELGYEEYFQGYGKQRGQYLGHGVGLELDELPVLSGRTHLKFEKNMVLAVECKFIIPDFGAVFLEDTVVIEEKGCQILSSSERDLFEVG